jgi:hypothetical protein
MIGRFLRGEEMIQPCIPDLPRVYVEPHTVPGTEPSEIRRTEPPSLPVELRLGGFSEVELALPAEAAMREARRCLRCDLHFTCPEESQSIAVGGGDDRGADI